MKLLLALQMAMEIALFEIFRIDAILIGILGESEQTAWSFRNHDSPLFIADLLNDLCCSSNFKASVENDHDQVWTCCSSPV